MKMSNSTTKRSQRAVPVKTIITRYKSQHKQHNDSRHHKSVTKSKSKPKPPEKYVWKQKKSKPPKEASNVAVMEDNCEFYPDKPKRKIQCKKVVLKPVHSMKMIGGTSSFNKRKLNMPRKDIRNTRQSSLSPTSTDNDPWSPKHNNQSTDMSIKDMVLLIEEQGGLDDEELLEILTCPSPVWWEDAPNGYIEDPIFARPKPAEQKSVKNQLLEEQCKEAERRKQRKKEENEEPKDLDKLDVSKFCVNVEHRGMNFVEKRSKLESLLNNIRHKVKNNSDGSKGDGTNNIMVYGSNEMDNEKCVKDDTNNMRNKVKNNSDGSKGDGTNNIMVYGSNEMNNEKCVKDDRNNMRNKVKNNSDGSKGDGTKNIMVCGSNEINNGKCVKDDRNNMRNKVKNNSDGSKGDGTNNIMVYGSNEMNNEKCFKDDSVNTDHITVSKQKNVKENIVKAVNTMKKCNVVTNKKQKVVKQGNRKRIVSNSTKDSCAGKPKIAKIISKKSGKRKSLVIKMKDGVKRDKILRDSMNKNEGIKSKIVENSDGNNVQYRNNEQNVNLGLKIDNKVTNSPNKSFEEDHLIDLTDHEIDSLEKLEIPIAPKIIKPIYKTNKSVNKRIDYEATKADLSSTKIKNTIFYDKFVNKPFSYTTESGVKCWENDLGKCVSNEITKCTDDASDETANNSKSNQKLDDVLYVKKFESNKNLTNDNKLGEIAHNHSASESEPISASNKNDIRSNNTTCKMADKLYFKNSRIYPSAKIETSSFVEKMKNICSKNSIATAVSLKRSREEETSISCNNSRLPDTNDDSRITSDCTSEKAFIETNEEYDDSSDIKNTAAPNNNILSNNLSKNDVANEIENKSNDNHNESETKVEINNVRRYSIDSATSDKNMSVEYLDMSLLDEDENKIEPARDDNESYESDDKINDWCDNDAILHIRNDNIKEKDVESFNTGCMSENFRCSSPIHHNKGTLNNGEVKKYNLDEKQQSKYNAIFKIANNDSYNECNLFKTDDEVKHNNDSISKKMNETEDSYDVEYLTEFDDIEIVGNEANFDTNQEENASINKISEDNLVRINKIENITNVDNHENFVKLNEVVDLVVKWNERNLTNPAAASKINNYFRQRKEVRHDNKRKKVANGENRRQTMGDACKSCSFKNKSISISDNKAVKYCYLCSSIYDTDSCKYCIKKLQCTCKMADVYICDKCSVKLSDKKSIIEHLNEC